MPADISQIRTNHAEVAAPAANHSISELIQRYSIAETHLCDAADGIIIHRCAFPQGRYGVGVTDGDMAWIIPATAQTQHAIAREVRDACYEEAERAQALHWQRAA